MKKPFSLFLALRYLKPKRTFVSVISVISVIGVTLGITVLILVIAVMKGFELELQQKVLGFDAHVIVRSSGVLQDWEEIAERLEGVRDVEAVAPFMQGPILVQFRNLRRAPTIRGIDPEAEEKITEVKDSVIAGTFDLEGDKCLVGSELAGDLGLMVGDPLTIYSPENVDAVIDQLEEMEASGGADAEQLGDVRQLVVPRDLTVTGIFSSGRYAYDSQFVLVPLHVGQELYGLRNDIHGIAVKTSDPFRAQVTKDLILGELGEEFPDLRVLTWWDLNQDLFDAIRMERGVMFFLLMFIVLVAAFGIMNTLITVTVQKTREIGIIKALGARTPQVVGIFMAQGMVVGFFGTITGLGLGMVLLQYRNEVRDWLADRLGISVFPNSVYQFTEIPAQVIPSDVAIICLSAFAICSVASLIPAYVAARLDPVKALRFE